MRKDYPQVRLCGSLLILLSPLLPVVTVRAQWTAEDSLRLQELLNSDKDIFIDHEMRSVDKPWMQFVDDLPLFFDDTTSHHRPQQIRLLPFSCFTSWNEDPFALQDKLSKEKKWKMHWQINKRRAFQYDPRHGVPAGMDPDVAPGHSSGAGVMATFDADKMLYESFTKRGRAIKRNRKRAQAWKTFSEYVPTLQDSLLFYKKLRKEEE